MKTVIIEDNRDVQELLSGMLKKHVPDIQLLGIASSIAEGLELLEHTRPQLLLLDIQLRDGTVFNMLNKLEEDITSNIALIFITAFGTYEYLYKALRCSAIDYLIKPIDEEQFVKAIQEARLHLQHRQLPQQLSLLSELLDTGKKRWEIQKLPVHLPKGIIEFVARQDILYLVGEENITRIHLIDGRKIVAMRHIGFYEWLCEEGAGFFRISKQIIINLQYLERLNTSDQEVVLHGSIRLTHSRRQGQALKKWLNSVGS
jgi:two-component system LytT family response regulator